MRGYVLLNIYTHIFTCCARLRDDQLLCGLTPIPPHAIYEAYICRSPNYPGLPNLPFCAPSQNGSHARTARYYYHIRVCCRGGVGLHSSPPLTLPYGSIAIDHRLRQSENRHSPTNGCDFSFPSHIPTGSLSRLSLAFSITRQDFRRPVKVPHESLQVHHKCTGHLPSRCNISVPRLYRCLPHRTPNPYPSLGEVQIIPPTSFFSHLSATNDNPRYKQWAAWPLVQTGQPPQLRYDISGRSNLTSYILYSSCNSFIASSSLLLSHFVLIRRLLLVALRSSGTYSTVSSPRLFPPSTCCSPA